MNCNQCRLKLNDIIDNEFSSIGSTDVGKHIDECLCCRQDLNRLKQIKEKVSCLSAPSMSSSFDRKLQLELEKVDLVRLNIEPIDIERLDIERADSPKRSFNLLAIAATFLVTILTIFLTNQELGQVTHQDFIVEFQLVGKQSFSDDEFKKWSDENALSNSNCSRSITVDVCSYSTPNMKDKYELM